MYMPSSAETISLREGLRRKPTPIKGGTEYLNANVPESCSLLILSIQISDRPHSCPTTVSELLVGVYLANCKRFQQSPCAIE
jgi:hypothetical protein